MKKTPMKVKRPAKTKRRSRDLTPRDLAGVIGGSGHGEAHTQAQAKAHTTAPNA